MNPSMCSDVCGFGFRIDSGNTPNKLSANELKYLLKEDVTFKCLHKRIEDGAILDNPVLKTFKCKNFSITLLNYTHTDIRFGDDGFLRFKDGEGLMEFDQGNCRVIAYHLEDSPEVIFFEQNDSTHERFFVEVIDRDLFQLYLYHPKYYCLPKEIFSKKKEHQRDAITLLIKASRLEDPNSFFNIIPMDVIKAILGRYDDALKKEFASQYLKCLRGE